VSLVAQISSIKPGKEWERRPLAACGKSLAETVT
jgi:hypothetical protein